jgi:antitoxin HigA-1
MGAKTMMKNPLHPGRIIRQKCLEPLGLSVTAAAKALKVSRQALNNVVNCKASLTADLAIRLEQAFGSTAQTWLQMQANYDLAQARQRKIRVQRYEPAHA